MRFSLVIVLGIVCFCLMAQGQNAPSAANGAAAGAHRTAASSSSSLPDWAGIWTPNFAGDPTGEQPSLTPASAAQLKAIQDAQARNEEPATDAANCVPPGMPTIMFMPYDLEFLFTPGRVTIIQEAYMQVRRVFTDGRSHPANLDPTFNGHSIGHWEGDTLVIDTVGLGHKRPLGFNRLDHGPQLHVVERIRLTAPDTMEIRMTLTDPDVLQKPWHIVRTFTRHREWDQLEFICEENNRNQIDSSGKISPGLRK
jgi:hypothetical protein